MPEASDFRYYMHDGTAAFSFELAGRLSDDGARELQQTWQTASSMIGGRSLIVDLSYVTGVDVAGQKLLRGWHDQGAQLVAKSPEARALIQSITGQAASELSATARHSTWLPFHMQQVPTFFLSAILASSMLLVSPVCAQQEQQGQQEWSSGADAAAEGPSKIADEEKTDQNALPTSKLGASKLGTSQLGTSNDRLFNLLPNFLTLENAGQRPPLTTDQKFKVVARSSFDYVIYPWYGLLAGISQAQNSEAGYGHGAAGYGKRYGAAFADSTIEGFMTSAVLPSLLRQDPRFYQSSNGRFLHRLGYAASRIVITRSDSGGKQFNYSEIFGSAISAGISTYGYHPHSDRTLPNTVSVWGSQVGYDTISIVIKEFWPDIRRMLRHKPTAEAVGP